jgi:hypothetical protein
MKKPSGKVIRNCLAASAMVLPLLLYDCGLYEKIHVTLWNGAFMLDSVSAGLISTEYDADLASGQWLLKDKNNNVVQRLYKYSFLDSSFTVIARLMADAPVGLGHAAYSDPWISYTTTKNGTEWQAIYNLKTKEERILPNSHNSTEIRITGGNYAIYTTSGNCSVGSSHKYLIYSIKDNSVIKEFCYPEFPYYVDSSGSFILFVYIHEGQYWSDPKSYTLRKLNIISNDTNTMCFIDTSSHILIESPNVSDFGDIIVAQSYINFIGWRIFIKLDELLNNNCLFTTIDTITVAGPDLSLKTGYWVSGHDDGVLVGNFKNKIAWELVKNSSKER